ncbi:MAG: hypothetical protein ABSH00_19570 [Bryobacteraceae bacterium]
MNEHPPTALDFPDVPPKIHCQYSGLVLSDLKMPEREGPGELDAKAPQPHILDEAADRQTGLALPCDPNRGRLPEIGVGPE